MLIILHLKLEYFAKDMERISFLAKLKYTVHIFNYMYMYFYLYNIVMYDPIDDERYE